MSSGNYYVRQAQMLETTLAECQQQVQQLEAANTSLRQLEANLLISVASLSSLSLWAGCGPPGMPIGSQQTSSGSTSSDSAGAPPDETEARIQKLCVSLSGIGAVQLYSTSLLDQLIRDPKRVASHLALSQQERIGYVATSVSKLGLLLPKHDHSGPTTSTGPARARLDAVVDELSERLLTYALCDSRQLLADDCLINLDTRQHEHYPHKWWQRVIQEVNMTADQKAALQTTWARVKPMQTQLRTEHSRLADRLAALQMQQQQVQRQFERQAESVMDAAQEQQQQQLAWQLLNEIQHMQDSRPTTTSAHYDAVEQQLVDSLSSQTPATSDGSCSHPEAPAATVPACGQTQQPAASSPPLAQAQSRGGAGGIADAAQLEQAFLQCLALQPDAHLFAADHPKAGGNGFVACSAANVDLDLDSQLGDSQLHEPSNSWATGASVRRCGSAAPASEPLPLPPLTNSPGGSAAGAAPGVMASGQRPQRAVQQELQAILAEGDAAAATSEAITKVLGTSSTDTQRELLLAVASDEQNRVERQMACITQQVKHLQSLVMLVLHNILSRKQLALQHIHAYPFVLDAISLCEALDDLGW